MQFNIDNIISALNNHLLISKIDSVYLDETNDRAVAKIRCKLIPAKYNLQLKWIIVNNTIDYAYQLYSDVALLRWDNSPHFPDLERFPHHFHNSDNQVLFSDLTGDILNDLLNILSEIEIYISKQTLEK